MSTYLYCFFLGSHPELSATEIVGRLHYEGISPTITAATPHYLFITVPQALPTDFLTRLGGTDRIAHVFAQNTGLWNPAELWQHITAQLPPDAAKITLGLSVSGGLPVDGKRMGIRLKEQAKLQAKKLRFVVPSARSGRLNAAQVLFNNLLEPANAEITLLRHDQMFYAMRTTHVQDIVAYERRDTQRPARDARVGLLPPKLAQIMLNIGTTPLPPGSLTILDPFCGMGTILQEGWLLGHSLQGSDASPEMVAASQQNLDWVAKLTPSPTPLPRVQLHDVTQPFPSDWHNTFDAVVTEPYLGRPLHHPLPSAQLEEQLRELGALYYTAFQHLQAVVKPGGRLLFLLPTFRKGGPSGDWTLFPSRFLDAIAKLGYSPQQLVPAELANAFPPSERGTLLYSRPDALVGRELTLWQKHS